MLRATIVVGDACSVVTVVIFVSDAPRIRISVHKRRARIADEADGHSEVRR